MNEGTNISKLTTVEQVDNHLDWFKAGQWQSLSCVAESERFLSKSCLERLYLCLTMLSLIIQEGYYEYVEWEIGPLSLAWWLIWDKLRGLQDLEI